MPAMARWKMMWCMRHSRTSPSSPTSTSCAPGAEVGRARRRHVEVGVAESQERGLKPPVSGGRKRSGFKRRSAEGPMGSLRSAPARVRPAAKKQQSRSKGAV